MNQTLGLVLYIIYNIVFIAFHLYRFTCYTDGKKSTFIIYWGSKIAILLGIGAFMLFSFPEYVMFCWAKMTLVTIFFAVIIVIQLIILTITEYEKYIGSIFLTLISSGIIIIVLLFNFSDNAFVKDETPIINITRRDILTAADNYTTSINGETYGNLFYVHGYINSDEKMTYTYYYLSNNGKEAILGKCNEDNTKIIIIGENEKPYIEVINTEYKYINTELKEPASMESGTFYNHEPVKTTTYKLYAPISAFDGKVELDAK